MPPANPALAPGPRDFGAIHCITRPEEPRLVEFTYTGGFSLADFRAAMHFVPEYAAQQGVIAILSEVRGTAPAGAGERRKMVEIVSELDAKAKGLVCASAVVTDSGLMRGVLTAVGWVHSPPYPLRPFASDVDARAWLREHLASRAR